MALTFSSRVSDPPPANRLSQALASAKAEGRVIVDLTASNPTQVGLRYPTDRIGAALARGAEAVYEPDPRGTAAARTTLAHRLDCTPRDLMITASTSEAYSFLFKLLANPGDDVVTARPSYPLLEHLASIESCGVRQFPLQYERGAGWSIDIDLVRDCLTSSTRAVVIVHPNNPTGSFVSRGDAEALGALCAERQLALISDEVFLPYPLDATDSTSSLADLGLPCLTASLGGLSKLGGMPHLKLGWMHLAGPDDLKRSALERLELIADNFLSVATPVQAALPDLLGIADEVHDAVSTRIRSNLQSLQKQIEPHSHVECLPVEAGWSAVLRVPAVLSDDDLAIRILEERGVLVHPGHFFDFESEGFLVVSLLPKPEEFGRGIAGVLETIERVIA